MNAYELADQLDNVKYQNGAKPFEMYANMLRQQADRIAELEKESANLEQSLKNALVFINNHKQTKPLSDEEILNLYKETGADNGGIREFVRAIEERHGIK